MSKYKSLQESAYEANCQLPKLGLVLFTFGNASAADQDLGVFAIKPSGVPYEALSVEKMVVVDFEGQVVRGKLRPSSDSRTHALLYRNWSKLGGIVHTHSTFATSWAQAQQEIPIFGTTHADHLSRPVPLAPPMTDEMIEGDYELNTGFQILDAFQRQVLDYEQVEMILVAGHAPFTWGKTVEQAVYNSAVLESLAQMAYYTRQINADATQLQEALIKKHFLRKHGPDAYYGQ